MRKQRISRRRFTKVAVASAFAFTYIPRRVWGANERLLVAGIGVGGKGAGEVTDITAAGGTFVALCDVDAARAVKSFSALPDAKRYTDFRVMLEKEKGIDAVTVSTPDHTHAAAALMAMSLGKHVYCQKPLTHTIHEARLMAQAAEYFKVQTQMGNQAHAGEPIRRAVELVRAGIIGPVREVHAWTNRPIWPQGQNALNERKKLEGRAKPNDLDWDLWLGPAAERTYNACYAPFAWRGWWDFGTGALGDMACHIMDMPYWALDLGSPLSVEAESYGSTQETGPDWSTITYQFAARKSVGGGSIGGAVGPKAAVEQPAVKFVWYDGTRDGKLNALYDVLARASAEARERAPQEAASNDNTQSTNDTAKGTNDNAKGENTKKGRAKKRPNSSIDAPERWDLALVGDQGTMLFNRGSTDWIASPNRLVEKFGSVPQTIRRVANEDVEWIEACRGGPKPLSSFDYSGPFTEMVLLGNLAVRLNKKIEWDSRALKATNAAEADELIRVKYRQGWDLPDIKSKG